MRFLAALLIVPVIGFTLPVEPALAQDPAPKQRVAKKRTLAAQCQKPAFAQNNPKSCARFAKEGAPTEQAKQPEQPSRPAFTADEQAVAPIPGMPAAPFWAEAAQDFLAALPATPGPWLVLSTGGGDGAFGAGLLHGGAGGGQGPGGSGGAGGRTGAL